MCFLSRQNKYIKKRMSRNCVKKDIIKNKKLFIVIEKNKKRENTKVIIPITRILGGWGVRLTGQCVCAPCVQAGGRSEARRGEAAWAGARPGGDFVVGGVCGQNFPPPSRPTVPRDNRDHPMSPRSHVKLLWEMVPRRPHR